MNVNAAYKVVTRGFRLCLSMAITAIVFCSLPAISAPYGPDGKAAHYRQPDGTTVRVRVFGDEFYAVAETEEGYTVVYDNDKVLCYGTLSADGRSIVPTGIRASNKPDDAGLQASGIKKSIRLGPQGRKEAVARGLQRRRADRRGRVTPESVQYYERLERESASQPSVSATSAMVFEPPVIVTPAVTRTGTYVGLCILVDFPDQAGQVPPSDVDNFCNKPGYTGYGNAGSIYDYYFKQSNGRLQYNNIVTAYVRVPNPKTYYDDGVDGTWGDSRAQDLVSDALDVLIAQGFDFTRISRNGSGVIYSVNIFYAGTCASDWSTGLWPHQWAIPTKTVDAANRIKAADYQMTDMGTALEIGTFCHENGHMLMGYPDLYPYNGNAADFGSFSLMASSGSTHPVNIDPYLKTTSGWADIVDLTSNSHQRCTVQVDANLFYRYRSPSKANEYFIFEVRDNTGYEGPWGGASTTVNPASGLVAYHIREDGSSTYSSIFTARNPTNAYTTPYEALVLEANPSASVTPWYDDPTPGNNDAFSAGGISQISDSTTPAMKFWDATGRNTTSGAIIHSISADGPAMTFVVGAGILTNVPSIVLGRTTIDSSCDLGGTALSQTFTIGNGQGGTLNYTISDNQSWLSCSPTSGTATTESDTITVDFATSGLAAGTYSATITVTDPAASPTTDTITVGLSVNPQPSLNLSTTNIVEDGNAGEAGPQVSFAVNNTGGGVMTYSLGKTQNWLVLAPTSGTVVAETDTVYVDLSAAALPPGTYNDTITITAPGASNSIQTIGVGFTVYGEEMILTAPNGGERWTRGTTQAITWLSSFGGTVTIDLLKNGVFSMNLASGVPNSGSHAWAIPANQTLDSNYRIRITSVETPEFSDLSLAEFTITVPPAYYASMDVNPGWSFSHASWAFGQPTGAGQDGYGAPDPTSGYNGPNVIGYRLDGDYEIKIGSTRWATTPAIDCSNHENVKLSFQRWLGIEQFQFDKVFIEVSNNNVDWTPVWLNSTAYIDDQAWIHCEYDISAVADSQATVYVRWGLGTTDDSWNWCGWNIDEVIVDGDFVGGGAGITITESGGSTTVTEGGATDTYTIVLNTEPTASVTVTITPDSQVSVSPANLVFTTGNWASPQTVTVTAVDDDVDEGAHAGTIGHSVTSPDPAFDSVAAGSVLVSITDNDAPGTLGLALSGYSESEAGGSVSVSVTRTGGARGEVRVDIATRDGTAVAGDDYTASAATLTWADNDTNAKSFGITILDNSLYSGNRTFHVNLGNATGGTSLALTNALVTIIEDEVLPSTPVGLSATPSLGQVDLAWTASANATGYKVKRAAVPGGSYTTVGTPAGTGFADMAVTNGSTYYYVVSAVGSVGESPDSAEVEARLLQVLPFAETFDGAGMLPGALHGRRGWTGGSNTLVQAGAGRGGGNGLGIAGDVAAIDFLNGTNTVTLGFWIKPVAGAEPKPAGLPTNATAVIWVGTNQHVMVYSNTTVVTLPVQVAADQWCHFEANVDYAGGAWSLAVNGTNAASGLGLFSAQARFTGLEFLNTSAMPSYLDDISMSSILAALTDYENWLVDHFSTTSVDDGALASNGVNTIREAYIIGLDPSDPSGRFAISGIADQPGLTVLGWESVSGRLYSVYWSSNLLGGAAGFQLLHGNIPWTAGSFTDTVHNAEDTGFYRIDVQLE